MNEILAIALMVIVMLVVITVMNRVHYRAAHRRRRWAGPTYDPQRERL